MNDDSRSKLQAYQNGMPVVWRFLWDEYPSMQLPDLLRMVHTVAQHVNEGQLTLQQAGAILSPITGHPVSTSQADGELVALGLLADDLSQGPQLLPQQERDYLWAELLNCLRRVESAQLSS